MVSFKTLAAVVLLSATAATPAFAQGDRTLYIKNLHDSGYNPKSDFNPNGTIRAAIQEPGLFAFYYPNLDVLNGGAPTPAARLSPDWPALRGACASAGAGVSYCGERYGAYDFAPDAFARNHGHRHHRPWLDRVARYGASRTSSGSDGSLSDLDRSLQMTGRPTKRAPVTAVLAGRPSMLRPEMKSPTAVPAALIKTTISQ
jgi:hypothetical protein